MNSKIWDVACEIWAVAQLHPGEGIEDGVERITQILDQMCAEVCGKMVFEKDEEE